MSKKNVLNVIEYSYGDVYTGALNASETRIYATKKLTEIGAKRLLKKRGVQYVVSVISVESFIDGR